MSAAARAAMIRAMEIDEDDACPNCGYPVTSYGLRLVATPLTEPFDALVESLACNNCEARWEEWD